MWIAFMALGFKSERDRLMFTAGPTCFAASSCALQGTKAGAGPAIPAWQQTDRSNPGTEYAILTQVLWGLQDETDCIKTKPFPRGNGCIPCREQDEGGIDHNDGPSTACRLWKITVRTQHEPTDPDTARRYL